MLISRLLFFLTCLISGLMLAMAQLAPDVIEGRAREALLERMQGEVDALQTREELARALRESFVTRLAAHPMLQTAMQAEEGDAQVQAAFRAAAQAALGQDPVPFHLLTLVGPGGENRVPQLDRGTITTAELIEGSQCREAMERRVAIHHAFSITGRVFVSTSLPLTGVDGRVQGAVVLVREYNHAVLHERLRPGIQLAYFSQLDIFADTLADPDLRERVRALVRRSTLHNTAQRNQLGMVEFDRFRVPGDISDTGDRMVALAPVQIPVGNSQRSGPLDVGAILVAEAAWPAPSLFAWLVQGQAFDEGTLVLWTYLLALVVLFFIGVLAGDLSIARTLQRLNTELDASTQSNHPQPLHAGHYPAWARPLVPHINALIEEYRSRSTVARRAREEQDAPAGPGAQDAAGVTIPGVPLSSDERSATLPARPAMPETPASPMPAATLPGASTVSSLAQARTEALAAIPPRPATARHTPPPLPVAAARTTGEVPIARPFLTQPEAPSAELFDIASPSIVTEILPPEPGQPGTGGPPLPGGLHEEPSMDSGEAPGPEEATRLVNPAEAAQMMAPTPSGLQRPARITAETFFAAEDADDYPRASVPGAASESEPPSQRTFSMTPVGNMSEDDWTDRATSAVSIPTLPRPSSDVSAPPTRRRTLSGSQTALEPPPPPRPMTRTLNLTPAALLSEPNAQARPREAVSPAPAAVSTASPATPAAPQPAVAPPAVSTPAWPPPGSPVDPAEDPNAITSPPPAAEAVHARQLARSWAAPVVTPEAGAEARPAEPFASTGTQLLSPVRADESDGGEWSRPPSLASIRPMSEQDMMQVPDDDASDDLPAELAAAIDSLDQQQRASEPARPQTQPLAMPASVNATAPVRMHASTMDVSIAGPLGEEDPNAISSSEALLDRAEEQMRELVTTQSDVFRLFQDFLRMRRECGESTEGLTLAKFSQKLNRSREQLMERYQAEQIRFSVEAQNGRATLRARPLRARRS
jgi:hypothetical protein